MKKLNQQQQLRVETVKEAITKLQETEEIIYNSLIQEIGGDSDWLYDYVFNCSSLKDEQYTLRVKSEIFE